MGVLEDPPQQGSIYLGPVPLLVELQVRPPAVMVKDDPLLSSVTASPIQLFRHHLQ